MVLTNFPPDPLLDLDPWVGQRSCTFRFDVVDAVSLDVIGEIHPIRGASLTHDTGKTIKRQLTFSLGTRETAQINTITDRVSPWMVFPNGQEYPLGRYMFTDGSLTKFTSGNLGDYTLNDEMFLVDQQIRRGIDGTSGTISDVIQKVLDELPITYQIEPSPFGSRQAWAIGTNRGSILEALAVSGDYYSGWFDNNGIFRMIRVFNPFSKIPDLNLDAGNRVIRSGIVETSDLLTAPNVIVILSNIQAATLNPDGATNVAATNQIVGLAFISNNAPNSVQNRGFEIVDTRTMQLTSAAQAQAVANGIAQRQTVFERVTLTTPPDPRHDGYNVIHWQGEQWLELSWSMALVEGGKMNHLLRKAYS